MELLDARGIDRPLPGASGIKINGHSEGCSYSLP